MPQRFRYALAAGWIVMLLATLMPPLSMLQAEDDTAEAARQLLQKGLTLHEINAEVDRLEAKVSGIDAQIAELQQKIDQQKGIVEKKKAHAAKVLRAYYTGERSSLWLMLLSVRNMSEAISVLEYLNIIFENDHYAMNTYQTSYRQLTGLQDSLLATRSQLKDAISLFRQEQSRLAALQSEFDQALAARADKAALQQQMESLNADWQQHGLPAFQEYLGALSAAMDHLNNLLEDNPDMLEQNSLTSYTLHITDRQLNAFLRKENPIFADLVFAFKDGSIAIDGKKNNLDLHIQGRYAIAEKPRNAIVFQIDRLTFNGYDLPDTTIRHLEEKAELSFSPQDVISFLQATDLHMLPNELTVNLKLSLSP